MRSRQPGHPTEENDCRLSALLPPPSWAKAPTHTCLPAQPVPTTQLLCTAPLTRQSSLLPPQTLSQTFCLPITLWPSHPGGGDTRGHLPQPPTACSSLPLPLRSLPPDTAELQRAPLSLTPEKKTFPLFWMAGGILWYNFWWTWGRFYGILTLVPFSAIPIHSPSCTEHLRQPRSTRSRLREHRWGREAAFTPQPGAQRRPLTCPPAAAHRGEGREGTAPRLTHHELGSGRTSTGRIARSGAAHTCCRRLLGSGCEEEGAGGEQVGEREIKSEGR